MILKSSKILSSKAIKKYESLKDIDDNYLFEFKDVELYNPVVENIKTPNNKLITYKQYKTDIINLTCSCDNNKPNELRFICDLCPHLINVLKTKFKKNLSDITLLLLENRPKQNNEIYVKLNSGLDSCIIVGVAENSKWLNVYYVNNGANLLKFDTTNKKWAYNLSPVFADETKAVFEDFINNNLVVK